jgi:hypothetical protein
MAERTIMDMFADMGKQFNLPKIDTRPCSKTIARTSTRCRGRRSRSRRIVTLSSRGTDDPERGLRVL